MNRYQLAKLVEWAGTLHTRKRMQKVIYLLQSAGAPFDADFTLHHYGPYSYDVARLTDEMVRSELLVEESTPNATQGESFQYRLSETARTQVKKLEGDSGNANSLGQMKKVEAQAMTLLNEHDLSKLEYAATIAYFYKKDGNWVKAREAAAKFKNQPPSSPAMNAAEELARQVLEPKSDR